MLGLKIESPLNTFHCIDLKHKLFIKKNNYNVIVRIYWDIKL